MTEKKEESKGAGPGHAAEERLMRRDRDHYPSGHRPQASDTQTGKKPAPIAGDDPKNGEEY